jgi:hypothetical protein
MKQIQGDAMTIAPVFAVGFFDRRFISGKIESDDLMILHNESPFFFAFHPYSRKREKNIVYFMINFVLRVGFYIIYSLFLFERKSYKKKQQHIAYKSSPYFILFYCRSMSKCSPARRVNCGLTAVVECAKISFLRTFPLKNTNYDTFIIKIQTSVKRQASCDSFGSFLFTQKRTQKKKGIHHGKTLYP